MRRYRVTLACGARGNLTDVGHRHILRQVEEQGWRRKRTVDGWRVEFPGGGSVVLTEKREAIHGSRP